MSGLLTYLTASEEEIITKTSNEFEKMLKPYYTKFKTRLFFGSLLLIIGFFLVIYSYYAIILILIGTILVVSALRIKIHVKELNVTLYPVLAVPYGDGQLSLLVDPLSESGEQVNYKVSRIDLVSNELNSYLENLTKLVNVLKNPSEQQETLTELQRDEDGEYLSTILELSIKSEMKKIHEILLNRPYDDFSFRLFRYSKNLNLYPAVAFKSNFLLTTDLEKLAIELAHKINSLLKSLEIQFTDLLENTSNATRQAKDSLDTYYTQLEVYAEDVYKLTNRVTKALHVKVCPKCLTDMRNSALLSSQYPTVLVNLPSSDSGEEGYISYVCPRCGSTYHENVYSMEDEREPLKMYWFEVHQSRTWSRLYLSRLDEINRFISDARKYKREKYYEAVRKASEFVHQSSSLLFPVYIDLSRLINEIKANNSIIGYVRSLAPASGSICTGFAVSDRVQGVEIMLMNFLGGEVSKTLIKELDEKGKLKIKSIFLNEVALQKLIEAYKRLGEEGVSEKVRQILNEGVLEDLENFLKEAPQEARS